MLVDHGRFVVREMVEYVTRHTGIQTDEEATNFLQAALRGFAESLTRTEAERMSRELPAPASQWLMEVEHGHMCSPQELFGRIQRRTGLREGTVVEWVPVAISAVARELSPATRQWLLDHLGDAWSALLSLSGEPSSLPPHSRVPMHEVGHRRTLAEGRPGSAHPLSESRPSPQPDSVLEDNPYSDRKLSSAQDACSEPMSSSNPRSKHPLSEEPEPK